MYSSSFISGPHYDATSIIQDTKANMPTASQSNQRKLLCDLYPGKAYPARQDAATKSIRIAVGLRQFCKKCII
jgi:hypothetical protein